MILCLWEILYLRFEDGCVVYVFIPNGQYNNMFILGQLDDTPANIKGGTIKIGTPNANGEYPYTVLSDGSLDIGYGKFTVSPTGNVHFSGEIKGARFVTEGSDAYTVIDKGAIQTYTPSGYKGVRLYGNSLIFYDYHASGKEIGKITQSYVGIYNMLSIFSSNNCSISMGYRNDEGRTYTEMMSINSGGNKKTMISSSKDGGHIFFGGVAMTDVAIADGNHIIQAGWNGSKLFFYVFQTRDKSMILLN